MVRAVAPRQPGAVLRHELYGVAVLSAMLFGVIRQAAGPATFEAENARTHVRLANRDPSLVEPQVNNIGPPVVVAAQQTVKVRGGYVYAGDPSSRGRKNDRVASRTFTGNRSKATPFRLAGAQYADTTSPSLREPDRRCTMASTA